MTFIQKFRELFQVKKDNSSLMSFISVKILFAKCRYNMIQKLALLKLRKVGLNRPIQGLSMRGRVQICRFIGYESLMMSRILPENFSRLTFRALALRQADDTRDLNLKIFDGGHLHYKLRRYTKLSCNTRHRCRCILFILQDKLGLTVVWHSNS